MTLIIMELEPCMDISMNPPTRFFITIGWVKSANGQNSWMTSLSYARDRAPKVLVNLPRSSLIVNFDWPNINYFFLQCNKMRVVGHRDGDNFYLVNPF